MQNNVVFFSDRYRVTATENGQTNQLPVYQSLTGYMRARNAEHVELNASEAVLSEYNGLGIHTKCREKTVKTYYTLYAFEQTATLEILLPEETETVIIKPREAAQKVTVQGNRLTVTTDQTLYFVIEPDGDIFGGLRVFLDRMQEKPLPKEHILAFTDGIYTADNCEFIHLNEQGAPVIDCVQDNTLIYIGSHAIVNAAIVLTGVKNVEISGNGILTTLNRCQGADSGFDGTYFLGLFREHAVPNLHIRSGCENILIRNILIDSEFRGIILRNSKQIHIQNVKIFTSTHNADGINAYNTCELSVDGCFIQSRDDCFCLYNSCDSIPWLHDEGATDIAAVCRNVEFRNCLLMTNCRPFVFGGHATGARNPRCLIENLHIHDCTIFETPALLNPNETFAFYWTSVFRILSQSEQIVRNLTFENITVEVTDGYCGKLFHLHVRNKTDASYTECRGFCIENVLFRNITVRGNTEELYPSVILCREPEADETDAELPHISGISFENVTLCNRPLSQDDLRTEGPLTNLRIY